MGTSVCVLGFLDVSPPFLWKACVCNPPLHLSSMVGFEKLHNSHDWGKRDQANLALLTQLTGLQTVENYCLHLIGYNNFNGLTSRQTEKKQRDKSNWNKTENYTFTYWCLKMRFVSCQTVSSVNMWRSGFITTSNVRPFSDNSTVDQVMIYLQWIWKKRLSAVFIKTKCCECLSLIGWKTRKVVFC